MSWMDSYGGGTGWRWGDKNTVDPNAGSEQDRIGTMIKGGAGTLNGLFNDAADQRQGVQDTAYKNAQLMQAYQNNLPAMFAARQKARMRTSGLASLSGLY